MIKQTKPIWDETYEPTELDDPTGHPCGSVEKILVLQRRAMLGLVLYHPSDTQAMAEPNDGDGRCGHHVFVRAKLKTLRETIGDCRAGKGKRP